MLYDIDDRLHPDLLHTLASLGHGDCLAVVDLNFPAAGLAAGCVRKDVLTLDAGTTAEAVDLIARWLPLEEGEQSSVFRMQIDGQPDLVPPVVQEVADAVQARQPAAGPVQGLERHAFYERASSCFAIVRTRERRFYGSVILRTGVIHPD